MSLLWLTPICDPPVWVLRISNLGHYLFPSSAQGAPSEKTSQELRKLPDTSYLESQVWMSVCLSCFLSLSCLSCLSSWHLNLTFQVTCDWQLSQFLRFFIELNIFVERGYKCLHILCLWHPLISFPAKLAKLAFHPLPLSLANQRSDHQRDFPQQGELSIHSWLHDFKPCHHCGICFFQLPIIAVQLLNWLVSGSPKEFFHLKKQNWDSSGISHFNISSSILWFKIWRPNLWSQITNGLSGGIYENICFVHSPLKKSRVLNTYIILLYLSMHQESLVFLSNRKIDFSDLWSLSP